MKRKERKRKEKKGKERKRKEKKRKEKKRKEKKRKEKKRKEKKRKEKKRKEKKRKEKRRRKEKTNEKKIKKRNLTTHNTQNRHTPRWESNPQFQQTSGRRPTPKTAGPLGPAEAFIWILKSEICCCLTKNNLTHTAYIRMILVLASGTRPGDRVCQLETCSLRKLLAPASKNHDQCTKWLRVRYQRH
jgi:superfamily II DNA/RNA helicase